MTPEYKRALPALERIEGGYVDNPHDRGGVTNKGITLKALSTFMQRHFNRLATVEDVQGLTREVAEMFYFEDYWQAPGSNIQKIAEWWEPLGHFMFDCQVNHKPRVPGLILQRALNIINRNEKSWPDLKTDGLIGPATLAVLPAVDKLPRGRERLMVACAAYRFKLFIDICEADPTQEEFAAGWMFRAAGFIPNSLAGAK